MGHRTTMVHFAPPIRADSQHLITPLTSMKFQAVRVLQQQLPKAEPSGIQSLPPPEQRGAGSNSKLIFKPHHPSGNILSSLTWLLLQRPERRVLLLFQATLGSR